jgi:hypothetical protein
VEVEVDVDVVCCGGCDGLVGGVLRSLDLLSSPRLEEEEMGSRMYGKRWK